METEGNLKQYEVDKINLRIEDLMTDYVSGYHDYDDFFDLCKETALKEHEKFKADFKNLVEIVAGKTLQEPIFERCLRMALCVGDALNTIYGIDEAGFIIALSEYDKRFIKGYTKERVIISNNRLNPATGSVYISKNMIKEAKDEGSYVICTIRGKGI